jgi:hypothetical protein
MDWEVPDFTILVPFKRQEVECIDDLCRLVSAQDRTDLFNKIFDFGFVWACAKLDGKQYWLAKEGKPRLLLALDRPLEDRRFGGPDPSWLEVSIKPEQYDNFLLVKRALGEEDDSVLVRRLLIGYRNCAENAGLGYRPVLVNA